MWLVHFHPHWINRVYISGIYLKTTVVTSLVDIYLGNIRHIFFSRWTWSLHNWHHYCILVSQKCIDKNVVDLWKYYTLLFSWAKYFRILFLFLIGSLGWQLVCGGYITAWHHLMYFSLPVQTMEISSIILLKFGGGLYFNGLKAMFAQDHCQMDLTYLFQLFA